MKLLTTLLLIPLLLFCEIKEVHSIGDIEKTWDSDTLILLDLDNTIMETAQTLGSDQWFNYRIKHYLGREYSSQEALEMALAEWMAVQNLTRVKLVEPETCDWIEKLQKEKIALMGLTTRGLGLATRTIEQLHSIGIDLSKTAPLQQETFFKTEQGILYRKGILFTAGTNKGKTLFHFLQDHNIVPKKIIFIDDKMKYLKEVEELCLGADIPYLGLRYGFLDEKVNNFSPELTAVQWEHFGKLISDEAAEELLNGP